jgi:hypothetical protein
MENLTETTLHNNVAFIYEYTESVLKDVNKSIDNTTTKLIATIGFSGVLLRFAADLPDSKYSFSVKVGVCFLVTLAIGFCGTGLLPKTSGDIVKPEKLLEPEWYRASDELCRLYVLRQWQSAISQLDELLALRTMCLNLAIGSLIIASFLFALSIVLGAMK